MRIRITRNDKHPNGTVWIESGVGWQHLPGADFALLSLSPFIREIQADMSVDDELALRLYDSAEEPQFILPITESRCKICE